MDVMTREHDTPPVQPLTELADDDLEQLLLIRHFEQGLLDLFSQGRLNGTTHTCLGQEYIPVAMQTLLAEDDYIFSNHRGHGHYLARFRDPPGLLAEIMGRAGAVCHGVGGSQHIFRDTYLSTGVLGESMAVAVGVALHLKRSGRPLLAAVYVGDGAWGEGAIYEALNMAQLWRLPLLVLVENNGIAQSTAGRLQMAGTIAGRARGFGLRHQLMATADVNEIRRVLTPLVAEVRQQPAPLVIEFETSRLGPHSKGDDTRSPDQLRRVRAQDWYQRYQDAFPDMFGVADTRQRARVASVIEEISARPTSTWEPACESPRT